MDSANKILRHSTLDQALDQAVCQTGLLQWDKKHSSIKLFNTLPNSEDAISIGIGSPSECRKGAPDINKEAIVSC